MKPDMAIHLTEQNAIAEVHLNWPDASQLDRKRLSDLSELMDYIEDESDCTTMVFRGISPQQPVIEPVPPEFDYCSKWEKFLRRVEQLAGVSIACIDGTCTRFHLQLAIACDYRVATPHSVFAIPEIKEGYLPGMSLFRLAKYTGIGTARRLLFSGAPWSAAEAEAWGILDRQCEAAELESAVLEIQQSLMPMHPEVIQRARRLLNESFATSYEDAIGHFLAAQNLCLSQLPPNRK